MLTSLDVTTVFKSHLMRDFMQKDGEGGEEPDLQVQSDEYTFTIS